MYLCTSLFLNNHQFVSGSKKIKLPAIPEKIPDMWRFSKEKGGVQSGKKLTFLNQTINPP